MNLYKGLSAQQLAQDALVGVEGSANKSLPFPLSFRLGVVKSNPVFLSGENLIYPGWREILPC